METPTPISKPKPPTEQVTKPTPKPQKEYKSYGVEIDKILDESRKRDPLIMEEAEKRNVIIVGKTRGGKTTMFTVMKDPTHLGEAKVELFSGTEVPTLHTFAVKKADTNYSINIIDTPGLFESYKLGSIKNREDDTIKRMIRTCLQYEVRDIHAIFFVCSFKEGVDKEQMAAFVEFAKMFGGAEERFAVIITRCEALTETRKDEIKKEIKELPDMDTLLSKMGGTDRIFFMGAVPEGDVTKGFTGSVGLKIKNVRNMRTLLYDFIFSIKEPTHITKLYDLGDVQKGVEKDIKTFDEELAKFTTNLELSKKDANINKQELLRLENSVAKDIVFLAENDRKRILEPHNKSLEVFYKLVNNHVLDLLAEDVRQFLHSNSEELKKYIQQQLSDKDTLPQFKEKFPEDYDKFVKASN